MDKRITGISPEAMDLLASYDWPGNVRELSNAIERAMVVGRPPAIRPDDLPLRRPPRNGSCRRASRWPKWRSATSPPCSKRTGGNITRAAEILKVDRVTVYNKIKKYGLRP